MVAELKVDEQAIYRLGQKAGEVFSEKVQELFEEFSKNYETADPNFDNEIYRDGFWKGFIDNVGFVD